MLSVLLRCGRIKMATYVVSPPPGALRCDSSELVVIAPDERAAHRIARDAGIDSVHAQVEGVAQTAVWKSTELTEQVAAMKNPHTYYTLGKGIALYESHWSFPLQVYVADRRS